jgi:hypothetical protein
MKRKKILILLVAVLASVCTSTVFGQDKVYKVGDTVYVNAFYGGCVRATVLVTDPAYEVRIHEGTYKDRNIFYNANRIGECKQTPAQNNQNNQNNAEPDNEPVENTGSLKAGDRVDVYNSDKTGINRGTIVDVEGSQYTIRYDGCDEEKTVAVNQMFVRPAATAASDHADIKYLIGKWAMSSVGISDWQVAWGKAPGIQINSDGSYVWYQDGGKPPVKGKWSPHAKIETARYGSERHNGIIIKDAKGAQWKMYKVKSLRDEQDRVNIFQMCQAITQTGTRIR